MPLTNGRGVPARVGEMGTELKLLTGSTNLPLAEEIAARLGLSLCAANVKKFNDGEVNIQIQESVRGCHVYILQSCGAPINDALVELLLMISAARRASAASVTAVLPYYPYSRQTHRSPTGKRVPISAADVAKLMEAMGVNRVLSVDLHVAQIQGFFGPRCPVDNLYAAPAAVSYFHAKDLVRPAVVSPDAAGVARAKLFCEGLTVSRDVPSLAVCFSIGDDQSTVNLVGDVEDCDCIIVDDLIDSGRTLCSAANHLKVTGKARRIFAFATHALFSGSAPELIEAAAVDEVIVANTIELPNDIRERTRKIRQLSVGKLLADAVRAIQTGTSVSELFASNLSGANVS